MEMETMTIRCHVRKTEPVTPIQRTRTATRRTPLGARLAATAAHVLSFVPQTAAILVQVLVILGRAFMGTTLVRNIIHRWNNLTHVERRRIKRWIANKMLDLFLGCVLLFGTLWLSMEYLLWLFAR